MKPDQLDPEAENKNLSQQEVDDEFNKLTSTPDMQASADQANAAAKNVAGDQFQKQVDKSLGKEGGFYKPSKEENLEEAEGAGAASGYYNPSGNPEAQALADRGRGETGRTGLRGKLAGMNPFKGRGSMSGRKKALIAMAGLGGGGAIIGILILIFFLISGFGVGQLAEVLKNYNFGRIHVANYRRAGQLIIQESLEDATVTGGGKLKQLPKSSLYEKLRRFDANKALTKLGQEGQLKFYYDEGKSSWKPWQKSSAAELKSIQVGDRIIDVPEKSRGRLIQNYRTERDFIKQFDEAFAGIDGLAEKSRFYRSRTGRAVLDAAGIKLSRWANKGRNIRNLKDSLKSRYDNLKGNSIDTGISEIDNAADNLDDAVDDLPDNPAPSVADDVVQDAIAKNGSTFGSKVRSASMFALIATGYCVAYEYADAEDKLPEIRDAGMKATGAQLLSAEHQYQSGDVTAQAIMSEAKAHENFSHIPLYLEATGQPVDVNEATYIGTDEFPYPRGNSPMAYITGQVALRNIPGVPTIISSSCGVITSNWGQAGLAVGEAVVAVFTAGGSEAAAQGILRGITAGLGTTAGRRAALRGAGDALSIFAIDFLIQRVFQQSNNTGNSGLAMGEELAERESVGIKMLASEQARAMGGKPLNSVEVSQLNKAVNLQRIALDSHKNIFARVLSPDNPYSPSAQFIASLPVSSWGLKKQSKSESLALLNPFKKLALTTNKAVAAVFRPEGSAFAASVDANSYGVATPGFTTSELERMLDDQFWPQQNANWVASYPGGEAALKDKYGKCFTTQLKDIQIDGHYDEGGECSSATLSTDEALHYRLHVMDSELLDQINAISEASDVPTAVVDDIVSDPGQDTSSVPCPPGTTPAPGNPYQDYGPNGVPTIKINICGIPSANGVAIPEERGVNSSAARQALAMIEAAEKAGITLTGNAFRSYETQQQLRVANCPDPINSPSSACSPPTAQAGDSMHEVGLALDFSNMCYPNSTCPAGTNAGYDWLTANAARFGFKKLSTEAWHWSIGGK